MSLSEDLIDALRDRIEACEKRLEELDERREYMKETHDEVRKLLYDEWRPEKFDPDDPKTYPPCLRNQRHTLNLLDKLNEAVGYALKFVIKYRYPRNQQEPPPPVQSTSQPQQPIVIQTGQQQEGGGSRVRSWWTGFWEVRLEKMRLQYLRELAEREAPKAVTPRVVRDPIEVGNELLAALHETKKFLNDCYLVWPIHRTWAFALNVHEALRDRLTRLLSTIEAFCYAALDQEKDRINDQLLQQIGFFTRVLEAQAQAPVTIQEISRLYSERGYRDLDFEPRITKRRGGGEQT